MSRFWSAAFAMALVYPMTLGVGAALAVTPETLPANNPVNESAQPVSGEETTLPLANPDSSSAPNRENNPDANNKPAADSAASTKESTCSKQVFQSEVLDVPVYLTYSLERLISPSLGFALGTLKSDSYSGGEGQTDTASKERTWIPPQESKTGVIIQYQKPLNNVELPRLVPSQETKVKDFLKRQPVYGGRLTFASFFPGDRFADRAKAAMDGLSNLIVKDRVNRVRFTVRSIETVGPNMDYLLFLVPTKDGYKPFNFLDKDGEYFADLQLGDKAETKIYFTQPGIYRLYINAQTYLEGKDKDGKQKQVMGPKVDSYYTFLIGAENHTLPSYWEDRSAPVPCVVPSQPGPEPSGPEPSQPDPDKNNPEPVKPAPDTNVPKPPQPDSETGLPVITPDLPAGTPDSPGKPTVKPVDPSKGDPKPAPKPDPNPPVPPGGDNPSPSQPDSKPGSTSKPKPQPNQPVTPPNPGETRNRRVKEPAAERPSASMAQKPDNPVVRASAPNKRSAATKPASNNQANQPASNQSPLANEVFRARALDGYELANKLDSTLHSEVPGGSNKMRSGAPAAVANRVVDQSQNTVLFLGLGLTAIVGISIAGTGFINFRGR